MRILVTGVGGPAGRTVSRLLWETGHEVIGADMCSVSAPDLTEFRLSPAAMASDYVAWLAAANVDLIIPTVQEELPLVAAALPFIPCPVLIAPAEAVAIAHDKYHTAQALAQANLDVPRFGLPSAFTAEAAVSEQVGWPCLSKPRLGRGGRGVTVYDDPIAFPVLAALDDTMIVQEFVPGVEYTVNLCLNGTKDSVVVVLQKLALREGRTGNAAAVQRISEPHIANLAVTSARVLGLTGPLDMDIRCRDDGTPLVLEINARFGANIGHAPEVFAAALHPILS